MFYILYIIFKFRFHIHFFWILWDTISHFVSSLFAVSSRIANAATTGKDVFKQQLITTNPQCFNPFEKYALQIASSGSFSQVVKGKNIKHLKPPPGTDNFIFPQAQTSSNSRPLLSFFPLFLGLAGAVVEIKPNLEHGEK